MANKPNLRTLLLRPRHLLATALVVFLTGGGLAFAAAGVNVAQTSAQADPWSVPFAVPVPKVGDHVVYRYVAPEATGGGDSAPARPDYWFPTVEFQWLADGEGLNATGARVVVNRLLTHDPNHPSAPGVPEEPALLDLIAGTGREVHFDEYGQRQDTPGNFPFSPNATYEDRYRTWSLSERDADLWCGTRNVLQGHAMDLRRPAADTAQCWNGPGSWNVDGYEFVATAVAGVAPMRYVNFTTSYLLGHQDPTPVVRWSFREDIPYPIRIQFLSGDQATYEMAGFQAGTTPIASSVTVLAPPPPPAVFGPRQVWGPDETGVNHPWPLSKAFEYAKNDPQYPQLRAFLLQHPTAYIAAAGYQEMRQDTRVNRGWVMVVADEKANLPFFMQQMFIDGVPGGLPAYTVYRDAPNWSENMTYLPASAMPKTVPTVASLMEMWSTVARKPVSLANGWGFDFGTYCPTGVCPAAGYWLRTGRTEDVSTGFCCLPASNLDRRIDVSEVTVGGNGRLIQFRESNSTQKYGFANSAQAPATTGTAPRFAALPSTTATLLSSVTPAAAAAAGFGALLVGLAYFFWPAVKASPLALFTRIRGNDALHNPIRARLMQRIEAEPGVHLSELIRFVGQGNGTTEHHLEKLEKANLVVARRAPGYTCYFPANTGRREMDAAPLLKSPVARAILETARKEPGVSSAELGRRLNVSAPSIHYHVERLSQAGLIAGNPEGGRIRLSATPAGSAVAA